MRHKKNYEESQARVKSLQTKLREMESRDKQQELQALQEKLREYEANDKTHREVHCRSHYILWPSSARQDVVIFPSFSEFRFGYVFM